MADTAQPLIPSNSQPAGVPETPGAGAILPFSLPADYTPEQAQQRLAELKSDYDWQTRWLAGDARASSEFDALTRKAVGQQPAAPAPVPDENQRALEALGPPPNVKDYKIDIKDPTTGWPMQIDAAERAVIDGVLLPAAYNLGLSQGDVAMIGDIVVKPMDAEQCETTLKAIWRGDFEQGIKDFVDAMNAQPQIRELLLNDRYQVTLQNNAALIASIVSAFRRRQGRSR